MELIDWSPEEVKKGGFPHYMLKEIYEQPQAFFNTIRAIDKSSLPAFVCKSPSVTLVACGSSYRPGSFSVPVRTIVRDTCPRGICFGVQIFPSTR